MGENARMTDSERAPATVRHVVHIRLEPTLEQERRESLESDLRTLVAEHPHAIRASLHRDLGRRPEASVSATWMVVLDFATMADFEGYLASPAHRHFLTAHQPSMAYISAIQVPIVD
jgi:antibiotic biosynthesis monooxygenase (ABM) superfamily enzyme